MTRPPGLFIALAVVLATTVSACSGEAPAQHSGPASAARPAASSQASPSSSASAAATTDPTEDPATLAGDVDRYARRAGIHPQLLMAILYNESYKPHDPQFQRAWLQMDPDASLGVANMHRAAYDDTKRGRDFAHRPWEDLIDDPALGVEAAAWYLHDLSVRLPRHWRSSLTRDELLALGYNAGPGNMLTFAGGVPPGPQARAYLEELHGNWTTAADALRRRESSSSG